MTTLIFIIMVIGAVLPGILWLVFFIREDLHPVPRRVLIYTFGAGAISSFFVLTFQFIFHEVASERTGWIVILLGLAFIEEIFKFLSAYFAVWRDRNFKEPMHAMIFALAAALGFATVENIFALAGGISTFDFSSLYSAGYVLVVRFLGATMLHALAAGIVGYYWAKGTFKGHLFSQITLGVLIATAVHTIFNYLVVTYQESDLMLYPALFLVFILFFVITDFEILQENERYGDALRGSHHKHE